MHKTTRNLFISTVTLLLLAGAINSQVIAGRSGSSHGNKKGIEAGQPLNNFDSNQSKIQQTPKNRNQFKHLEQEERKLQDQRELLARNQNRVEEMTRLQVATQQPVRNKQLDIKQEGVRLRDQEQLTARLKTQIQEERRILQMESNRGQIKAMNLNRAQIQNQFQLLQEQRSQLGAREKLALEEEHQLQERRRVLAQQKNQIGEQERLLNQQQEQIEERVKLMIQQHMLLQERQRLWAEIEPGN